MSVVVETRLFQMALAFCLFILVMGNSAWAQIESEDLLITQEVNCLAVRLDGKVILLKEKFARIVDPLGEFRIVRSSEIFDDLKLKPSARSRIQDVISRADKIRKEANWKLLEGTDPPESWKNWMGENSKVIRSELTKILGSKLDRLKQLSQQQRMLDIDLADFASASNVSLSKQERLDLKNGSARMLEQAQKDSIALHKKHIDLLLTPLKDEQVQMLDAFAANLIAPNNHLDLLLLQLTDRKGSKESEDKNFLVSIGQPAVFIDIGENRLQLYENDDADVADQRTITVARLDWAIDFISDVSDGSLGRMLAITDDQRVQLKIIMVELELLKGRILGYIANARNSAVGFEGANQIILNTMNDYWPRIAKVLDGAQIEKLELVKSIAAATKRGLLSELLYGKLGEEIGISQPQREELRKIARKSVDELVSKRDEIVASSVDGVLQVLGAKRRLIDAQIGEVSTQSISFLRITAWLRRCAQNGKINQ